MNIGLSVKIDVTKIDKARLFKGEKGTYLDLTTFIDTDNPGQYGDHGFISQSVTKEEREQKVQAPILGNVKVFYQGESDGKPANTSQPSGAASDSSDDFSDEIPFMRLEHTSCF